MKVMLGRCSNDEIWSRFVFELVIWSDLNPRVRCAFGNVCDNKYKPNTNTCVIGGTFLLFRFLLQRSPTEESQPKHWMRTQKTQNNNINKRSQETWHKNFPVSLQFTKYLTEKKLKRFSPCPSYYLSRFGELQPPKSEHPCFSFHHYLNLDQEKLRMCHVG